MQVAPKCNHINPFKIEAKGDLTHTHRGRCDHRDRGWSDVALSQEGCSHPSLGARNRYSPRTPSGGAALLTPTLQSNDTVLDLWLPEL